MHIYSQFCMTRLNSAYSQASKAGSGAAHNFEKVKMSAVYSKLLISCLCVWQQEVRDTSSPCLKGRKQCEKREDVSDLVEGSPGLTLKPRRLKRGQAQLTAMVAGRNL